MDTKTITCELLIKKIHLSWQGQSVITFKIGITNEETTWHYVPDVVKWEAQSWQIYFNKCLKELSSLTFLIYTFLLRKCRD